MSKRYATEGSSDNALHGGEALEKRLSLYFRVFSRISRLVLVSLLYFFALRSWSVTATMSLSTPAAVTSAPAPGPVTTNGLVRYRRE